jgi:hypothetical protein
LSTHKTQDEIRAIHVGVLNSFIPRARRIAAHSLLRDREQAQEWATITMKAQLDDEHRMLALSMPVPEEEALESLAARVRPLLLVGDSVNILRAIKSAAFFARVGDNQAVAARLEAIRKRVHDTVSGTAGQYEVQLQLPDEDEWHTSTNLELAEAWLYGDVVHADHEGHKSARLHDIHERYAAAVGIYMNVALMANALVENIKDLQNEDPTICSLEAITSPVVADVQNGRVIRWTAGDGNVGFIAPSDAPSQAQE